MAPLIGAGTFLAGLALMPSNTLWETTLQRHIPSETLSRVSSYDWFGSLALDPIGLAIWGPIAALVGIEASLWTAGWLLLAGALALFAVPEIRRLPAYPGGRGELRLGGRAGEQLVRFEAVDLLIWGDTESSPALRHEVPADIGDPFLYLESNGRRVVVTNALEEGRIARAAPDWSAC